MFQIIVWSILVSLPLYWVTWKKKDFERGAQQQQTFERTKWVIIWDSPDVTRCKKHALNPDRDDVSSWNIFPEEPGETLGWPLGSRNREYEGSKACYAPTEKEILATNEGIWASSEVVGTEAQVILHLSFLGSAGCSKGGSPPGIIQLMLHTVSGLHW